MVYRTLKKKPTKTKGLY